VKAYNSNGLWLRHPELVAAEAMELRDEGGFTGFKLWLGRKNAGDDLKAIDAVRVSVGDACHAPALGIKAIDAPGFKVDQKLEAGHV
jgi:mandelate racemase